jgi:oxidase EvaA
MRVHRGTDTRYLEYFRGTRERQVLVDSLQSEQGAWFFRKRNRNIVVEVGPEVPAQDGFHWMDLDVLRALMAVENLVSMDARSVLSCMTFLRPGDAGPDGDAFVQALKASYEAVEPQNGAQHSTMEILSWFTEAKAGSEVRSELIPLDQVKHWTRTPFEIIEDAGADFRILAVDIVAPDREVPAWSQPVLAPCGTGLAVFLTRQINGVLHVLIQALSQQGLRDVTELAPTVQHPGGTDVYLEAALTENPAQVRFDTVLSEEGGRFYHALTRYRIVEVDDDFQCDSPAVYRWLTVRQLTDLVRHGHYLNVEARSLLACLHSLW